MNKRQQRFCDEYLIDLNATQAAIRAGYNKKTAYKIGSENLRKPQLKSYIERKIKEKEDELIAKEDEVLKYLTSVLRGKTLSEEIVVEGTGDGCSEARTIEKAPSEKEKLKAAELLGKRYSLFKDKTEVEIESNQKFADICKQLGGDGLHE